MEYTKVKKGMGFLCHRRKLPYIVKSVSGMSGIVVMWLEDSDTTSGICAEDWSLHWESDEEMTELELLDWRAAR